MSGSQGRVFLPPLVRSQEQGRTGHRRLLPRAHAGRTGRAPAPRELKKALWVQKARRDAEMMPEGEGTPDLAAAASLGSRAPTHTPGARPTGRALGTSTTDALLSAARRGPRMRGSLRPLKPAPDRVPGLCLGFSTVWVKLTASFQIILSQQQ